MKSFTMYFGMSNQSKGSYALEPDDMPQPMQEVISRLYARESADQDVSQPLREVTGDNWGALCGMLDKQVEIDAMFPSMSEMHVVEGWRWSMFDYWEETVIHKHRRTY